MPEITAEKSTHDIAHQPNEHETPADLTQSFTLIPSTTSEGKRVVTICFHGTCCNDYDYLDNSLYQMAGKPLEQSGALIAAIEHNLAGTCNYDFITVDGPGSGNHDHEKRWAPPGNYPQALQIATGLGLYNGIEHVVNVLEGKRRWYPDNYQTQTQATSASVLQTSGELIDINKVDIINTIGHSRGGTGQHRLTHYLKKYPHLVINAFVVDPVPGLGMYDDYCCELASNVNDYVGVYALHERSLGFSPVIPTGGVNKYCLSMPTNHGKIIEPFNECGEITRYLAIQFLLKHGSRFKEAFLKAQPWYGLSEAECDEWLLQKYQTIQENWDNYKKQCATVYTIPQLMGNARKVIYGKKWLNQYLTDLPEFQADISAWQKNYVNDHHHEIALRVMQRQQHMPLYEGDDTIKNDMAATINATQHYHQQTQQQPQIVAETELNALRKSVHSQIADIINTHSLTEEQLVELFNASEQEVAVFLQTHPELNTEFNNRLLQTDSEAQPVQQSISSSLNKEKTTQTTQMPPRGIDKQTQTELPLSISTADVATQTDDSQSKNNFFQSNHSSSTQDEFIQTNQIPASIPPTVHHKTPAPSTNAFKGPSSAAIFYAFNTNLLTSYNPFRHYYVNRLIRAIRQQRCTENYSTQLSPIQQFLIGKSGMNLIKKLEKLSELSDTIACGNGFSNTAAAIENYREKLAKDQFESHPLFNRHRLELIFSSYHRSQMHNQHASDFFIKPPSPKPPIAIHWEDYILKTNKRHSPT
ncbi:MAG: hypothetical protein Tsb005_19970 [Gammaproteobacteria bacterium]